MLIPKAAAPRPFFTGILGRCVGSCFAADSPRDPVIGWKLLAHRRSRI